MWRTTVICIRNYSFRLPDDKRKEHRWQLCSSNDLAMDLDVVILEKSGLLQVGAWIMHRNGTTVVTKL
jgi:hypothetical protein